MVTIVRQYIEDAQRLQKCGDHDVAVSMLTRALCEDKQEMFAVEIHKLLSFSHRKLGNNELALVHINRAIGLVQDKTKTNQSIYEYAVCLMNKGVVCESAKRYDSALESYQSAVTIFQEVQRSNPEHSGALINALITLGLFYINQNKQVEARECLTSALDYFGADKETDRRYVAICNTLTELQHKTGG